MRLYRHDDPRHTEASELLPWFVNGSLLADERMRVELHLADCIACKQELQRLRSWHSEYRANIPDADVERGLSRVQARIDEIEASVAARSPWRRMLAMWRIIPTLARAALLGALFFAAGLWSASMLGPGSPRSVHVDLSVKMAPAQSERDMRALLLTVGARIVDGPTPDGRYTLRVEARDERRAIEALSAQGAQVQERRP